MAMELLDAVVKAREIKKTLDLRVQGRLMIRQDKKYKGLQLRKIWNFTVYFDTPLTTNQDTIKNTLASFGAKYGNMRIVGGTYGFVIDFRLGDN